MANEDKLVNGADLAAAFNELNYDKISKSEIVKKAVAVEYINNVSADANGRTKCYKHGDLIILDFAIITLSNVTATGFTTIMTIPSGYRPNNYVYTVANCMNGENIDFCTVVIDSDGNLQANLNGVAETFYTGSISWTI